MPVLLRCAKRWMKWPYVNTDIFEQTYYIKDKPFKFVYIEINYRSLAGELQQLIYDEDKWGALTDGDKYIKGEFISAYYVFQHVDNDGSLKEDKVKKKNYRFNLIPNYTVLNDKFRQLRDNPLGYYFYIG